MLNRIPSTREDVFANKTIPTRSKRSLMKFLKFVLDFESEPHAQLWKPKAKDDLAAFLESEFKLDHDLRSYVLTLTLSLDGRVTVADGLTLINRHLTSMGVFGTGFAAVYPKWGGLSEIAQVGCRAAAVGGAVYMLGTGISEARVVPAAQGSGGEEIEVKLTNDVVVKSRILVQDWANLAAGCTSQCRLTAVVESSMPAMFETIAEGTPTPCVSIVAFPPGSLTRSDGTVSDHPVYASVHSSDTGECPSGQSIVYLSTISGPTSKDLLELALSSFLRALSPDQDQPKCLYRLSYEQRGGTGAFDVDKVTGLFSPHPPHLAFDDALLIPVRKAWDMVMGDSAGDVEYMQFEDREGAVDDDDAFAA
ncbi:Rab proteins geranylgeranyltransferase component A [Purpureocillium takamizusanense]|nr:Rab proteins geranylgeranyltransferase component A [Purpureocillium takamizusanense]UNI13816.1 Rab proteins geranylgeranyltransferase component A [Purpureocillium takamizusanense]